MAATLTAHEHEGREGEEEEEEDSHIEALREEEWLELLEVPYTLFYEHDDVLLSSKRVRQVRKEQEQLNSLSLSRDLSEAFLRSPHT